MAIGARWRSLKVVGAPLALHWRSIGAPLALDLKLKFKN